MRYNRVIVASGTLRTRAFGMRHALVVVVVFGALLWAGVAFAQEAYIGHKLSQQVADLRHQNTVLAAQNQGYKKDVQAITTGTASEEEARLNGYARPQERLYLITAAPTPSPAPSPSASPHTH
jgi:cell division protein FtsB